MIIKLQEYVQGNESGRGLNFDSKADSGLGATCRVGRAWSLRRSAKYFFLLSSKERVWQTGKVFTVRNEAWWYPLSSTT